ncbi:MAG TPA: hypothetical protein VFZ28_11555 [Burkholderiaceae bacterium]|nr:hypothetical protein [Burkholderiaceae bacterium]
MNASAHSGAAVARASSRRRQRAALARQLIERAPHALDSVDWDTLDDAPEWMAWDAARLDALQQQVGALMLAPELRLWIDAARIAAATRALGAPLLHGLMALPDAEMLPRDVAPAPRIERADQVAPSLCTCGAGVLLAALPSGSLRQAAALLLTPTQPSPMAGALARSLVARAMQLAARLAPRQQQETA